MQIGLVDMLYRKSLRITAASKGRMGVGAIVNLQSNDASKLWGMAQFLHILWSGPFQVMLLQPQVHVLRPLQVCIFSGMAHSRSSSFKLRCMYQCLQVVERGLDSAYGR